MTDLQVFKKSALVKPSQATQKLATRLEHARQRRNERVEKADALYVDEVRAAIAALGETGITEPVSASNGQTHEQTA